MSSDAEDIIKAVGDALRGLKQDSAHVRVETLGCGEITVPVEHVTLHMVGGTYRLLLRDDVEWREISGATYHYIQGVLDYA